MAFAVRFVKMNLFYESHLHLAQITLPCKDGMKRERNLEKHPFVIELLGTLRQRVFLTFYHLELLDT